MFAGYVQVCGTCNACNIEFVQCSRTVNINIFDIVHDQASCMMRMFDHIQRMRSLNRRIVESVQSFFRRRSSEAAAAPPKSSPSRHHQHYSYRRRRLHNHTLLVMFRNSLRELIRLLDMIRFVVCAMHMALDLVSAH